MSSRPIAKSGDRLSKIVRINLLQGDLSLSHLLLRLFSFRQGDRRILGWVDIKSV